MFGPLIYICPILSSPVVLVKSRLDKKCYRALYLSLVYQSRCLCDNLIQHELSVDGSQMPELVLLADLRH